MNKISTTSFWKLNNLKSPVFYFTEIADAAISFDKVNCSKKIQDILNDNLEITHYSKIIQSIDCYFIIVKPTNKRHKASKKLYNHTISWSLKLNYHEILIANLGQVTSIMATAYLEAIKSYFKNGKHNFDGKRFYEEVRQLFEKEGWLKAVVI